MGWSFMVPKPASNPAKPKARLVVGLRGGRAGRNADKHAGEVMGAGCGIRTGVTVANENQSEQTVKLADMANNFWQDSDGLDKIHEPPMLDF